MILILNQMGSWSQVPSRSVYLWFSVPSGDVEVDPNPDSSSIGVVFMGVMGILGFFEGTLFGVLLPGK